MKEIKKKFETELSSLYSKNEIENLFFIFAEEILKIDRFSARYFNKNLSLETKNKFLNILSDLKKEKPYQQILGKSYFWGLDFLIDENVLIPRPETEELIELTIKKIQEKKTSKNLKILDIGTGSGIIPVCLKKQFPEASVSSIDISSKAIEIAKKNSLLHKTNINFIYQDYLKYKLNSFYDIIISNPPYIGRNEFDEITNSVKNFEPNLALFPDSEDVLIFYRKIAKNAQKWLSPNGMIFLEINQKLGKETLDLFHHFKNRELIKDLSGNDRFIFAEIEN